MTRFLEDCRAGIMAQVEGIPATLKSVDPLQSDALTSVRRLVFTGCGDSFAVADYARWLFLACGLNATYITPPALPVLPLDEDSLVVGITASGRSLATVDALDHASREGAQTVVLTDNPNGPAVKHAETVWLTRSNAPSYDISPASPTTCAMAFLLGLAAFLDTPVSMGIRHDLPLLVKTAPETVRLAQSVGLETASWLDVTHPIYLISEGPCHVAAQIGMMKFNEYSVTRGVAAVREEFRHHWALSVGAGDNALLIVGEEANDTDMRYVEVLRTHLGMRGTTVSPPASLNLHSLFSRVIPLVIALQLAAYQTTSRFAPSTKGFRMPHAGAFKIY